MKCEVQNLLQYPDTKHRLSTFKLNILYSLSLNGYFLIYSEDFPVYFKNTII